MYHVTLLIYNRLQRPSSLPCLRLFYMYLHLVQGLLRDHSWFRYICKPVLCSHCFTMILLSSLSLSLFFFLLSRMPFPSPFFFFFFFKGCFDAVSCRCLLEYFLEVNGDLKVTICNITLLNNFASEQLQTVLLVQWGLRSHWADHKGWPLVMMKTARSYSQLKIHPNLLPKLRQIGTRCQQVGTTRFVGHIVYHCRTYSDNCLKFKKSAWKWWNLGFQRS